MSDEIKKVTDEELVNVAGGTGSGGFAKYPKYMHGDVVMHKLFRWVGVIQHCSFSGGIRRWQYTVLFSKEGSPEEVSNINEDDLEEWKP